MANSGYVECPIDGKQPVTVDSNEHVETFAQYTAKCPKCGKRLVVEFER